MVIASAYEGIAGPLNSCRLQPLSIVDDGAMVGCW
jgi:hypothetical protein